MRFNPYGEDVVNLTAALANRRPATVEELADRCRAAGLVLESPVTPQDLDRTHAVLEAWEKVVDAADEHERAELVNRMLAESAAYPRLTDHAGSGWHLHYRDDRQPLGSVLFALISVGTALHLAGRGMHRLRRCAVTGCSTIFADTSRTGRQRYCSQRCANRDAVRRHRASRAVGRPMRPDASANRQNPVSGVDSGS
ncbi:CGNR zinc finger domain-containing protein [Microtetraspora sp. AC03309]|uniref:CGNR zinc finger domain-containing protein n=1 Tax=Microtetraspora sp. AC03309 TaxID=2779376 RepID=UPI001E5D2EF6|nr:CGNR zinc finger domain-containing protein [Microtetraspora sp. AC03309]MCC5575445.1 CGNR zinc finger domain-containing protein [Microtetraspora sp. AC03309]